MEMDAQIWTAFPRELLLYQVLPRLPLLHRLRLRPVCKTWSTLLLSNSYIEHCSTTSAFSFLALFERKDSGPADPDSNLSVSVPYDLSNTWLDIRKGGPEMQVLLYDHIANSWHRLSRPLIPHGMPHTINMNGYVPLTSAGGLICFHNVNNHDGERLKLVVCNPVLNEWMNIPELIFVHTAFCVQSSEYLGLYPKESGKGFFLALACPVFLFDSGTKCWTEVPTSLLPDHGSYYTTKVRIIKGIAYILRFHEIFDEKGRPVIIGPVVAGYDLIQQEISLCSPLSERTCLKVMPQLFELYGQVVLIGYDKKYLCMWTYDPATLVWRLLKTIAPEPPGWDMRKHFKFDNFEVLQSRNLFYFYTYVSELDTSDCECECDPMYGEYDSDCDCHSEDSNDLVDVDLTYQLFDHDCNIFDVENNEWKKLPKGTYKGVGRRVTTFMPTLHGVFEANLESANMDPQATSSTDFRSSHI